MKADFTTKNSNKIDVILHGIETIGSAERSCDKDEMRKCSTLFQMVNIKIFCIKNLLKKELIESWMSF